MNKKLTKEQIRVLVSKIENSIRVTIDTRNKELQEGIKQSAEYKKTLRLLSKVDLEVLKSLIKTNLEDSVLNHYLSNHPEYKKSYNFLRQRSIEDEIILATISEDFNIDDLINSISAKFM
jgi:hypothetical protein